MHAFIAIGYRLSTITLHMNLPLLTWDYTTGFQILQIAPYNSIESAISMPFSRPFSTVNLNLDLIVVLLPDQQTFPMLYNCWSRSAWSDALQWFQVNKLPRVNAFSDPMGIINSQLIKFWVCPLWLMLDQLTTWYPLDDEVFRSYSADRYPSSLSAST